MCVGSGMWICDDIPPPFSTLHGFLNLALLLLDGAAHTYRQVIRFWYGTSMEDRNSRLRHGDYYGPMKRWVTASRAFERTSILIWKFLMTQ